MEAMIFDGVFTEATTEEGRKAETIRNVLLCGLESLNGRTIPASAFGGPDRAKALYENVHVYLNHDIENGPSRKLQELAGVVESVTVDSLGRPRGSIRLNGNKAGEELRELFAFVQKAEKHGGRLKDVGMSHVARYTFTSYDRSTVQSVDEVFSVDVVIRPATTNSFSESTQPVPEPTASDFLAGLGVDLQSFSGPLDYAFNERALFDRSFDPDTDDNIDVSQALNEFEGVSAEVTKLLDTI